MGKNITCNQKNNKKRVKKVAEEEEKKYGAKECPLCAAATNFSKAYEKKGDPLHSGWFVAVFTILVNLFQKISLQLFNVIFLKIWRYAQTKKGPKNSNFTNLTKNFFGHFLNLEFSYNMLEILKFFSKFYRVSQYSKKTTSFTKSFTHENGDLITVNRNYQHKATQTYN